MGRVIALRSDKLDKDSREDEEVEEGSHRPREVLGVALLALALFLLLSVGALAFGDGKLMGPVGLWVASAVYSVLGVGALLCVGSLLLLALRCLRAEGLRIRPLGAAALLLGCLTAAVLLHLALGNFRLRDMPPGGAVGEYGAELLKALVGTVGTALLASAGLAIAVLLGTPLSFRALTTAATERLAALPGAALGALRGLGRAVFPGDEDEDEEDEAERTAPSPAPRARGRRGRDAAVEGVPIVTPEIAGKARKPKELKEKEAPDAKEPKEPKEPRALKAVPADVEPAPEPAPRGRKQKAEPAAEARPEPVIAQRPEPALARARSAELDKPKAEEKPKAKEPPKDNLIEEKAQKAEPARRRKAKVEEEVAEEEELAAQGAATLIDVAEEAEEEEEELEDEEGEVDEASEDEEEPEDDEEEEGDEDEEEEEEEVAAAPPPKARAAVAAPKIEAPRPSKPPPPKAEYIKLKGDYQLPSIDLFDYEEQGQGDLDRQAMLDLAQRLEKTLLDYQVKGRVSEIHPGPVVTMYEFVPAPGTKLSKITALSNDLAMALEALRVRIVAPIPGKAAVGIEVPNKTRETVYLKEILADDVFTKAKSKMTMALGKDIAGLPVCVDLAKMPHLLVAGTTGSGKSVSVNTMVTSILCAASPDDVKMIMIDPKMLELSIYEGIPHLLLPVVTDPKKANLALKWAVDEMERRYDLISKAGVRDIGGYNKKIEKLLEERPQLLDKGPRYLTITVEGSDGHEHQVQVEPSEEAVLAAGGVVTDEIRAEISDAVAENEVRQERLAKEEPPRKLPYIVVLIDEFADLMMVASKEVETSVARIAQKARAAGIHLILATQRPSVDVITGLIKANFPSRIAFQVASRIDSRTILDAQGAENLLGMGDMLFTDRGQALRRIHGALITDAEIHRIVEHLKTQGQPIYDMEILKPRADEDGEEPEEDLHDEMYDQAVRLVVETRQASISMVQRRLRIGYNRAARMIERMEREGLVSAADGAKGREVLANSI